MAKEVATAVLAGRVVTDATGQPQSGVLVVLQNDTGATTEQFVTGPDGVYRFSVSVSDLYVVSVGGRSERFLVDVPGAEFRL